MSDSEPIPVRAAVTPGRQRATTRRNGSGRGRLLRELIGAELRRIRQEQGRTLAAVAAAANLSLAYLSELERGLKEASSEVLAALCAALGIDVAALLDGIVVTLERELIGVQPADIRLARTSIASQTRLAPAAGRAPAGPTACAA